MKVLVAYMSKTGNTRKVAEAIYEEIERDKEIKRVKEVKDLEGYDLAFLGFPVYNHGPDKKARRFLERQTKYPDPKVRLWAKIDDSQGQPDATRLERARVFARDIMEKVSS
jgi:flavodoxin